MQNFALIKILITAVGQDGVILLATSQIYHALYLDWAISGSGGKRVYLVLVWPTLGAVNFDGEIYHRALL